jgi:hypothetical protein
MSKGVEDGRRLPAGRGATPSTAVSGVAARLAVLEGVYGYPFPYAPDD